jgi:integrase
MSNGERLPLVVGPDDLPVPTPNQWMLFLRRPQVQAGTLTDEMRTVAHVHEWASRRGIDLDERFTSGNGLRPDEANALYQNLRYERSLGRRVAARRLTNASGLVVVAGATRSARVAIARDYLVWGLERTLYRLDVSDPRLAAIRDRCDILRRQAREFRRNVSEGRPDRIGLNDDQRTRLLEVIQPAFKGNPFNRPVRFRNWVLILLLLTFGYRRGEALKIYVTDVNARGRKPHIIVRRRPDDPNDTRANEPAVKTLGRDIPLDPSMADLLSRYIQHHRSQFPNADKSPFLFMSEDGKPLSLRSVNYIFDRIANMFPEFAGLLSPHVMRYTYNDMLDATMSAAKMDANAMKAAQNYLNGWSLTSEQGAQYARRANEERARTISLEHQRRMFS